MWVSSSSTLNRQPQSLALQGCLTLSTWCGKVVPLCSGQLASTGARSSELSQPKGQPESQTPGATFDLSQKAEKQCNPSFTLGVSDYLQVTGTILSW